jgi:hypothetical protein
MGQPRTAAECARIEKPSGVKDSGGLAGCATSQSGAHQALTPAPPPSSWSEGNGQNSITVIDDSWGVPGLGTDGTLAMGGLAIAAATVTIIAWRALTPPKLVRRQG